MTLTLSTTILGTTRRASRVGLTLIELVVVMVVLMILAAIVIPRFGNMQTQANSAADASIIGDVDRAVTLFENRYNKSPSGNDGLLTSNSSSTFYPSLHPNLQTSISSTSSALLPILYPVTLSAIQYQSLNAVGITGLHYNDDSTGKNATGLPSDSGVNYYTLAAGSTVAGLYVPLATTTPAWTSHGSTFPDRAFNINPYNSGATDTFVIFGIGQPCDLRGSTLVDSPILQAANPTKYYARMLMVYHIPGPSATTTFPAQFVGSFCPDGTCINDNSRVFNTTGDKSL